MKNKKSVKVLITILILLIIAAGVFVAYKIYRDKNKTQETVAENQVITAAVEEKKVQIFKGTDRPIAVMIDNHNLAWPQAGLNEAYMVYEIIAEGGETRLMALFKGADLEKIGPIRSARHYFIDYAMENDAIYVHFGQSPQAESDIKKFSINDINGIYEDGSTFWRVKDKSAPHNAVTSTAKLLESAKKKNYKTSSTKESVLKYVTDDVKLEDGQSATTIKIPHSTLQTVTYQYNEETQTYSRYARGKAQTDWTSGSAVSTKNIIITYCDNYTLTDSENKGRQGLKNIGTFDGYYITNGRAIKIKCVKEDRESQTKYLDMEGNEIKVNDGNTFVNICPIDAKVSIQGVEEPEVVSPTTNATSTTNKVN